MWCSVMNRPDILVIMSDQHNKQVLGCYGDPVARTPNLDRLAGAGFRFDQAYCPAPLCVPSRMSFMTARNPSANQVWHNGHVLSSGIPTWPDHLNWAGYETTLIGRMHFLGPDQRHGFTRRLLGDLRAPWKYIPRVACGQCGASVRVAGTGTSAYAWYDEQVADAACEFIRQRARGRSDVPFAATVGFLQPHAPYVAPPDLFEYYLARLAPPDAEENPPEQVSRHRRMHAFEEGIGAMQAQAARAAYYGMCENLDRLIGKILGALEDSGLADRTWVVYCSDHGDMLGEHGCWFKSTYYEGSAGIPLIIRPPGGLPALAASETLTSLMDLGPTFCDLADAPPMAAADGQSLGGVLAGIHETVNRTAVFAELSHDQYAPEVPSRMIRSGPWKLWQAIYPDGPQTVMFNLEDDPRETRNLAEYPEYAGIRADLSAALLRDWRPELVQCLSGRHRRDVIRLMAGYGGQDWEHGGVELAAPAAVEADVALR